MMEGKSIHEAIEAFRQFAQEHKWSIAEQADQAGHRFLISDGISKNTVLFSSKGRIISQGKDGKLHTAIQLWLQKRKLPPPAANLTIPHSPKASPILPSLSPDQNGHNPAHHLIVPRQEPLSQEQANSQEIALRWTYEQLGRATFDFLSEQIRASCLSSACIFLNVRDNMLPLSDYSILVLPFARIYESFLIHLTIQLGLLSAEQTQQFNSFKVNHYLNQMRGHLEQIKGVYYEGIIDTLQSVWRDIHHPIMFAGPGTYARYQRLAAAEQDIWSIHRAITRGYEFYAAYLDRKKSKTAPDSSENGLETRELHQSSPYSEPAQQDYPTSTTTNDASPFSEAATATAELLPAMLLPETSELNAEKRRIGIDESGKSDYFGPLVVSAVLVDQETEQHLLKLRVRDCKKVSDSRLPILAEAIKACCPYAIVHISPRQYNKLYTQLGNITPLLAWGHAQALEEILEQVECTRAIADRFGEESFLEKALLSRGQGITLEQRPHAEEDLAVAAASILARAEFLQELERLSDQLGMKLPKGSSDAGIITLGRAIVALGGLEALTSVAKIHIKTTRTILKEEIRE